MMIRSAVLRVLLLLSASAALARAHPGHPGHEDDPYRMEGLVLPLPELGYFLPLLALGACLALMRGKQRAALATAVALLLGLTAFIHVPESKALTGLLASAALALGTGAVSGRAFQSVRQAVRARK